MAENQELWLSILSALQDNKVRFNPVKGTQEAIDQIARQDGNIYFATDTKMIWLDTYIFSEEAQDRVLTRLLMGNGAGSGSNNTGFLYADASFESGKLIQIDENDDSLYYILKSAFPSDLIGLPLIDTLVINSNGWLLRVIERGDGEESDRVIARLVSSGSGSGGAESQAANINLTLKPVESYNLINGQSAIIRFVPEAAKDRQGRLLDESVQVAWKLEYTNDESTYIQYASGRLDNLPSGEEYSFEIGKKARYSSSSRLTLVASENNSNITVTRTLSFTTSNLELSLASTFSNATIFQNNVVIQCNQSGNLEKILDFYWDGVLVNSQTIAANAPRSLNIRVNEYVENNYLSHGYHTVKLVLSQYINEKRGYSLDPLEFEIALNDGVTTTPIIWLGAYKNSYYNYDSIQIPFRIYDPNSPNQSEIHLYKEGKEIEGSPRTITDNSKFSVFEIVDFDLNMLNSYTIAWENESGDRVIREITFMVEQDPNRSNFNIQQAGNLILNFDASGRSNSESLLKRSSWGYNNYIGNFKNFNWYNNGWITDENNKTCLRISNGAEFSIPLGTTSFEGVGNNNLSQSFEFQFKVRNIQHYSNLIHNITRYKDDGELFNQFYDNENGYKTEYTNYDAFLANYFKVHPEAGNYDDLIFDYVEKQIDLNSVICGYYNSQGNNNVVGICLGPQDAFFSNGTNTINVNYVEDVIINLSIVYSTISKLMYIYINGVLTGVIANTAGSFNIENSSLVFNSRYCDIDLYKIRVYNTALNVNDIVTNYAVDLKDVLIFDQNQLAIENSALSEYQFDYQSMINYNNQHIDSPIMPYIIFDTSKSNNGDKLSYSKNTKVNIGVEFVNTPLEVAYTSGELETLAGPEGDKLWNQNSTQEERATAVKNYYQHHCPSWTGEGISMTVQGTSSEFYPRRNYKLKTKDDDGVNIYLNKGPFAAEYEENPENTRQSYWYMDNYTAGTTKFTMKIDYMESSGTYNMGFANLVKNAYSKHPFDDLNKNEVFTTDNTVYTEVTQNNYDENTIYWYKNHKGNWKSADGTEDNLIIRDENDFSKTPAELWAEEYPNASTVKVAKDGDEGAGKWYTADIEYVNYSIPNTNDYRTSVQGFRTLAFHKKSDGSYTYIGMYNMLLDKGSDEMYGFKPDKTTGKNIYQKYLKNKKISKIAECWEFENNSRTFCSFRDPLGRKDLQFDVYTLDNGIKNPVLNSVRSAPVVVDSFEYRYHTDGDILDYVMDPDKNNEKLSAEDTIAYMNKNNVRLDFNKDNTSENYDARAEVVFKDYANWEKAVAWVWSTDTDSVLSGGTYREIKEGHNLYPLGNEWKRNTYYVLETINEGTEEESQKYVLDQGSEFDSSKTYYIEVSNGIYENAYLSNNVYTTNTYYIMVNGDYVLSSEPFNKAYTYYTFEALDPDEMADTDEYDRLVVQCTENSTFDSNETYYSYNKNGHPGKAVRPIVVTQEEFNQNPTNYYVGTTVEYDNNKQYQFDTKEYRADKFVKELEKHFDIEYLATYFVMTEVFECYDSRGKNAMFASWGPQKLGGDYIWYPIFYDIDTQLGINNTGIPSFEYNVDATENNNFSTSDSVLWNNFYKYFKSSAILQKYKHLRGITAGVPWTQLSNAPLQSVTNIEGWYNTDPNVMKNIVTRGVRPLVAINLDEYYKYITITNPNAKANGVGWMGSNGEINEADSGTYFYALQGNRSLSRQQFLTNRLEYIDSWLNQGNYARGGNNRIWGRIAANHPNDISDFWVEDITEPETSYYLNDGVTKRHSFDAEYWVNLTPIRSTYVTLGDDNEAYPSKKYDGINPVRFEISSIEKGVRTSANYPEQLLYIYGINQMSDIGDMSRLYWQEFKIEGNASHLTKLLLGSDEIVSDKIPGDSENTNISWYNRKVNPPTLSSLPLLKEANFSNIQIRSDSPVLNFENSEKLTNFRAVGSNLNQVKFAPGVALNTLYLPNSITSLELIEARQLTKLLTECASPAKNSNGELEVTPGLYIDGLFGTYNNGEFNSNVQNTNIASINIQGGNLGIDSYTLLKQFYTIRGENSPSTIATVNITNVNWSPYILVEPDESFDGTNNDYYKIDYHYGLSSYDYNEGYWANAIANKEIYRLPKNTNIDNWAINDYFIGILNTLKENNNYNGSGIKGKPNISGIVYINNNNSIDESTIRNELQVQYPELTFLIRQVNQKPTARFIYLEEDGKTYHYIKENPLSIQTLDSATDSNKWFDNPLNKYLNLDKFLPYYDFYGWGSRDDQGDFSIGNIRYRRIIYYNDDGEPTGAWTRPSGDLENDYTFYALFKLHNYTRNFYNKLDDPEPLITTYQSQAERITEPKQNGKTLIPVLDIEDDPDGTNLFFVNKFEGWALKRQPNVVVDLNSLPPGQDYDFVAVYRKVNVHENVLDYKYLKFKYDSSKGYCVYLNTDYILSGKITIPAKDNEGHELNCVGTGESTKNMFSLGNKITHIFFENESKISQFAAYAFSSGEGQQTPNNYLQYIEPIPTLKTIGQKCFDYCNVYGSQAFELLSSVTKLDSQAYDSLHRGSSQGIINMFIPGKAYESFGTNVFSNITANQINLIIGGMGDPCRWFDMNFSEQSKIFDSVGGWQSNNKIDKFIIYVPIGTTEEDVENLIINYFGFTDAFKTNLFEHFEHNVENAKYGWIET